jgi:Rieske Fe-S protein
MLQGIVAASALVPLAAGCRLDDTQDVVDAGVGNDGSGSDPGFAMCGNNLCLDLANPMNAGLANPGGSRIVPAKTDRILVVRTDANTFTTHSAVCTHAGCTVRFVAVGSGYACPCHGSKYDDAGAVTQGPATRPLKNYNNTFDMTGMMLTITLA